VNTALLSDKMLLEAC